ncbi:MAG TPA: phosphotransferase [Solirubrobacteraceae bacterium]|nr:phosphotransferase [Solirubrobacteraceae bacterium]
MLELADVLAYLLERRLLEPRDVVQGELRVTDASRLNSVFVVTAEDRCPLVVKAGVGVARETAVLERLHGAADGGGLAAFLPTVLVADRPGERLVLESVPGARDLRRHHAHGRFSRALAREAGRALAALHAIPVAAMDGMQATGDRESEVRVHDPDLEAVHSMSPAAKELTRFVQGFDDLCSALDRVAASPRADAVIHSDIRWDNLLAIPAAGSRRWRRLTLIDWELCEVADPAVDVGAFLGEYLRAWAQSVPVADPLDPGQLLGHAGLPLPQMRLALRAFWEAYCQRAQTPPDELAPMLLRAMDLAAVRLLTAALEEAQVRDELRARDLCLVPLSRNLLCRRRDECARLLGLDPLRGMA